MTDFLMWVKSEMRQLGLTQQAVAGNILTRQQISNVLNGKSRPGELFFLAIATSFRMSLDEVYQRAGINTGVLPKSASDIIARKIADLPPEDQETAEEFVDFLRAKRRNQENDERQDLIDKVDQLTVEQRERLIKTGDTLRTIREIKKKQHKTPPKNQPPSRVVQLRLE